MKLTTRQVAELLNVSPQAVRMLVLRGRLKRRRSSGGSWYDRDDVVALSRTRRDPGALACRSIGV